MTAMATATAGAALPRAAAGPWIGSPLWDLFWMFAALWGAVLLLAGGSVFGVAAVAGSVFVVDRLVSIAHSWSTTWMVLFSPLLATERRRRPLKFVWIPVAITLGAFALGIYVGGWQRFPASGGFGPGLWAFALYISLFWVLHFWHFGNQDFGVLSLYRGRAGQARLLDRRVDKLYTVLMMFLIQPIVYLSVVETTAFSELTRGLLRLSDGLLERAAPAALAAAALASLGVAGFELAKPNRSPGKLFYYVVILIHPLLLYGSVFFQQRALAYLYLFAYLWSHWLIAIGLVGRINTGFYRSRGDSRARALGRHALLIAGISGFVWLLTHPYTDYGLFNTDGFRYKQLLAQIRPAQALAIGLALGFFLAEQLLHYYCDRCLFRFRDAGVRRAVAPLL
jgi:hypothetical protein